MAILKIPVTKAGKDAYITVNTNDPGETDHADGPGDLNAEMFEEVIKLGLKAMLNRGMDKIQVAKLEGDKLKEAQAAALAKAQANLAAIKAGTIRKTAAKAAKVTGVLNTMAMMIARNMVKDGLKDKGFKVSYYPAAEITVAAKALLEAQPSILEMAKAQLEAREQARTAAGDVLGHIVQTAKVSDKLIKAAEDKKVAAKETLSAKQAGKPKVRVPKAKPQGQATAH